MLQLKYYSYCCETSFYILNERDTAVFTAQGTRDSAVPRILASRSLAVLNETVASGDGEIRALYTGLAQVLEVSCITLLELLASFKYDCRPERADIHKHSLYSLR